VREDPSRIGDLVRRFMQERGWLEPGPYEALFREWEKVAGPGLAAHSRLVDVRDGILQVEVDHPGWLQMAHLRKAALLEAARAGSPRAAIDDIRFTVVAPPDPAR
jgi:predicted nucleic acid-binding Zn ribbon protein